jgi:hypothetical protein
MKKLLINLCLFLSCSCFTQDIPPDIAYRAGKVQKAYINDPDGYTNVREKPDVTSSVLFKIDRDKPFFVVTDLINGNWYKIALYEQENKKTALIERVYENEGYIHMSRVQFVPKEDLEKFVANFKTASLPINSVTVLTGKDTLNGKWINKILIRDQMKRPCYIDKNGNLQTIKQYYGLYPDEPFAYGMRGKKYYFYPKIFPAGRIHLNKKYISLTVKVMDHETTFYDLWNLDKAGNVLSVVCLFWGMRDNGFHDEKVTFTIVDSQITKDGEIIWHENNSDLETFRTYKLNEDGYFQVIKEEQKGEYEY